MHLLAAAAAKSLQSCPTLCDLIDGSPPGSAVPGILQARVLEWVAIALSAIQMRETENQFNLKGKVEIAMEKAMATHSSTLAWRIP